uniref:Uncharacterized protein n=1 Tax=Arundo donax TaxID=35708 RepID=A0A0A9AUC3_ARUDO
MSCWDCLLPPRCLAGRLSSYTWSMEILFESFMLFL